jgi:NADPH-dependent curcumin reductase
LSDFRLEEVRIPEPGTGQVLLGVLYLSLDPYMRGRMDDDSSYISGRELFVDGGFAQV